MPGYEVIDSQELNAIIEIFQKNNGVLFAHGFDSLRNGSFKVREYELDFAKKFGFKFAQAVSSGSAALKIALQTLGVKNGDEVITQCHTFIATAEAIIEVGAKPVFVNIDKSLNMCPKDLEASITKKTKAIIPVHMLGEMANMNLISKIAKKYNIPIIEDCAQAAGASFNGKFAGSFSEIAAFSTDAGKTINTGEGGMLLTNSKKKHELARAFHDHGHKYLKHRGRGQDIALVSGFNYRMTELQAAIGSIQLKKLNYIIKKQLQNKTKIKQLLLNKSLLYRNSNDKNGDAGDTLVFFASSKSHAQNIVKKLKKEGIGTKNLPDALNWHFSANWRHLFESNYQYNKMLKHIELSGEILNTSIAIPILVNYDDKKIKSLANAIIKSL